MIELVWSKEASVKQALWDAFRDLYLTAPRTSKSNVASLYIACKLISLTLSATLAELTSLEQLLSEMKQQGLIAPTVVQTLLDIFGTVPPLALPADACVLFPVAKPLPRPPGAASECSRKPRGDHHPGHARHRIA